MVLGVAVFPVVPENIIKPLVDRDIWGQVFVIELAEDNAILVDKEMTVPYDFILSLGEVLAGSSWARLWLYIRIQIFITL